MEGNRSEGRKRAWGGQGQEEMPEVSLHTCTGVKAGAAQCLGAGPDYRVFSWMLCSSPCGRAAWEELLAEDQHTVVAPPYR